MGQHIERTGAHGAPESAVGLVAVILALEGVLDFTRQALPFRAAGGVVEEDVGLGAAAAAVYMQEHGAAVFVAPAVLAVVAVDGFAALAQAFHLVQGDGLAFAGFALAVVEIGVVADAVFGVLDDDAHFGSLQQEVACQAQGHVVGVLVFVELVTPHPADGARIGTAVSAHYVEAGAFELAALGLHFGPFFAEKGISLVFLLCRNRNGVK